MVELIIEEKPEMEYGVIRCTVETALMIMYSLKHVDKLTIDGEIYD